MELEAVTIVGIGGTTRADSSSERALRVALRGAEERGAHTELFAADALDLPMYQPDAADRTENALRLVDALLRADGLIVASPGYHGAPSGLIKNALDYVEDLRDDTRPYLHGRAVGCIACASGWQSTTTTLIALRSVVHALRGWPTPLGVCIKTNDGRADVEDQLLELSGQVVSLATACRLMAADPPAIVKAV